MRHLLANTLTRLTGWLHAKKTPRRLRGWVWSGPNFADAFRRRRPPSADELLAELKSTAWACASINAAVCASYAPRLYVATHDGQPEARCLKRALSPAAEDRLRRAAHLPARCTRARIIEEVLDHPLLDLLAQVNPVHNAYDLWELTTLYIEVHGCAYWHLHRGPFDTPESIWILPSQYMTPARAADSPRLVDAYVYRAGAQEQRFAPHEVIHFRYPDPRDPYGGGLSPLRARFEQAVLTSKYTALKDTLYDNRGLPNALITPAMTLAPEEARRYEAQWNERFREGGNGQVLVAENDLKVELLQQSMGDLAQLAEYSATKDDIANAFHLPLAYLTKETNLANLQAAAYQHLTLAIRPRLRRRDEKLNEQLLPLYDPSRRLFLAAEDPTPEDHDLRLRQAQLDLQFGVRSVNEVRAERGLPPVPWGDTPREGKPV